MESKSFISRKELSDSFLDKILEEKKWNRAKFYIEDDKVLKRILSSDPVISLATQKKARIFIIIADLLLCFNFLLLFYYDPHAVIVPRTSSLFLKITIIISFLNFNLKKSGTKRNRWLNKKMNKVYVNSTIKSVYLKSYRLKLTRFNLEIENRICYFSKINFAIFQADYLFLFPKKWANIFTQQIFVIKFNSENEKKEIKQVLKGIETIKIIIKESKEQIPVRMFMFKK